MKNKKLILIISIVVGIILFSVGGFLLYKYIEIKNAVVKVVLKDNLEADFADTLRVSSFIKKINGKIVTRKCIYVLYYEKNFPGWIHTC